MKQNIEFYKHNVNSEDLKKVKQTVEGFFLTTGKTVSGFEKALANYLGVKYSIGLTSATHGLEMALSYYNIGPDDEVITTPLSYTATTDAIEYVGAKPIFVDVEKTTGNINADLITSKINSKTRAIIPVHLYGQMANMKKIKKIAQKYNLKIIEDAAQCLEGKINGKGPGQLSDIAVFSFYATKAITCGEGGAIATNDKKIYDWFKKARCHGLNQEVSTRYNNYSLKYDKLFLGFKANMSNLQAAFLINQLKRVEKNLKIKEKICQKYTRAFAKIKNIKTLNSLPEIKHARHLYTILIPQNKRSEILIQLRKNSIATQINYKPIHLLSYYKNKYGYKLGDFPIAEKIGASTITLPLYSKLTDQEINYIIQKIKFILKKY